MLVPAVKGVDQSAAERFARLPEGMTYDEWVAARPVTRDESYQYEAGKVGPEWRRTASATTR